MTRFRMFVIIIFNLVIACHSSAISPEKISFNVGMGYGSTFNNYAELSYQYYNNSSIGLGIQYIYGDMDGYYFYGSSQDNYNNYGPSIEKCTRSQDFIFPYLALKNEFGLFGMNLFCKLGAGIGYGSSEYRIGLNHSGISYNRIIKKDSYCIGVIPSIGNSFIIGGVTKLSLELGISFIHADDLVDPSFSNQPDESLGYTRLFAQSSFAFDDNSFSQSSVTSTRNYSLNLGMGYSSFRMSKLNDYSPSSSVGSGYMLTPELMYQKWNELAIGFKLSILYGYENNASEYPEFDAERYELTGIPGGQFADPFNSDVYFFFPSIIAKRNVDFIFPDPYIKSGIGYGFGYYKLASERSKYNFNASGFGMFASFGNAIRINNMSSVNIELGYRYLKTGNMNNNNESGSSTVEYYTKLPLDFCGVYFQTSFSFGL